MLALASCLLLTTSALAADYAPYMGHQPHQMAPNYSPSSPSKYPIDYNDDLRVKLGSNLIYSFEQIRRDQPPQVEMRDEDIGRYMYRKPKTTTASPAPMTSRFNDYAVPMPDATRIKPQARYPDRDWNLGPSTTMAPPPPPPSPKWMDPQEFSYQPNTQYHPTTNWNTEYHPVNTYHTQPVAPTTDYSQYHIQPTAAPQYPSYPRREEITSTVQPHWTEIAGATASYVQQPVAHSQPQKTHHNPTNRGSHKFNWNDVTATEALYQTDTPAPQKSGPPPSIPTLSPWHGDNFGK